MLRELILCVLGIYACFLTWGITQERVSTTIYDGKKFKYFIFLNIVQSLIASLIAYLYLLIRNKKLEKLSGHLVQNYLWLSFLGTIASPFGYASLAHIDYPTMILGKSCKLVPVMMMNFLIYRRTFKPYKYLVVALITLGVSLFTLLQPSSKEHKGASQNSLWGIFLLSLNLMIDGAINSTQDSIFHRYKVSGSSMMTMMNLFSSVFMIGYLLVGPYLPYPLTSNEWSLAISFVTAHPSAMFDILLFGLAGAIGQCFIFHTLERFGALLLVKVTVTRKMFSVLLSAFFFNHVFSLGQWGGVLFVFCGIALEAYAKQLEKTSEKQLHSKPEKIERKVKSKKVL